MLIPRYFRLTRWLLLLPLCAAAVYGYLAAVQVRSGRQAVSRGCTQTE
jgi:hypothetical protein